jgi:uncharacterized protein (DUF952 family)
LKPTTAFILSMLIFHLITTKHWEQISDKTDYAPESLSTEGFIHCSTAEQLITTANRFFSEENELVILHVDSNIVTATIKYESADNQLFPHIYGKLNMDAVIEVSKIIKNSSGEFER